ncbi:uncharacterized protein VTP21DRAFT_8516 [Calcarisporiella thermophila]|uniref:uncharacterized protein n=1 Tax=Calcarisporiella thermophila TaxID=911321 RepID=UPI0037439ED0
MPSPPKPWERSGANNITSSVSSTVASSPTALSQEFSNEIESSPPALPSRPSTLTTTRPYGAGYGSGLSYGSGYSPYSSGYGGGYGSYSSPYSRYGSYGSYGTYGGTYSRYGYGGSMYGSGMYGGGMYGNRFNNGPFPGQNPDEPSLMQTMEQSTAATFQVIEQVVSAFGGFAQMLESTFFATHSSFMAMMGLAEQFGHLRNFLGQILGVFTLIRWGRKLLHYLTGIKPPANVQGINPQDFKKFEQRPPISKRPIVVFLLVVVGLPYLMSQIIRTLSRKRLEQKSQQASDGTPVKDPYSQQSQKPIRPHDLEFARALYDFRAESPAELSLKQGDIVAILSKTDPAGAPSQWWRGRTRAGAQGFFPSNYVEIIHKGGNSNEPRKELPPTPEPENHDPGVMESTKLK